MSNKQVDQMLAAKFRCSHCQQQGAHVERLAMSGTGLSRLFEIQPFRYAFVACQNCGSTEVFNLKMLEQRDNLGTFLEVLFLD